MGESGALTTRLPCATASAVHMGERLYRALDPARRPESGESCFRGITCIFYLFGTLISMVQKPGVYMWMWNIDVDVCVSCGLSVQTLYKTIVSTNHGL